MTDDLNDLKAALDAATPAPDPDKRAAHLRLAEENFDKLQESARPARPTSGRFQKGMQMIFKGLTTRGALTLTTAFVAVGVVVATPFGQDLLFRDNGLTQPEGVELSSVPSKTAAADVVVDSVVEDAAQAIDSSIRPRSRDDEIIAEAPPEPEVSSLVAEAVDDSVPEEFQQSTAPNGSFVGAESEVSSGGGIQITGSAEMGLAGGRRTYDSTSQQPSGANSHSEFNSLTSSHDGALDWAMTQDDQIAPTADSGADAPPPNIYARPFELDENVIVSPAPSPAPPPFIPLGELESVPEVVDTEAFPEAIPSDLKITAEEPVSTFSIDVDTAGYSVVRSSLMAGRMPPKGAVRVEEMINYFPYDYAAPEGDAPFLTSIQVGVSPWNSDRKLVHIGLQGAQVTDRPPLNLVFLIDTSGSMNSANKLPLLKQSFRLMLSELRPQDQVSIVTYAGSAGQVLEATSASERGTILTALDKLSAGGSTAGQAGLQQAYSVAESMASEGEVTRVILATDGDFNVGISNPDALKNYIADKRETGVYLSVLGFGRGNLDDATMQALAQNGNGQAAYIDTLSEAQKVLVDQLTGALFPIANDVKIQVEFNPAEVAEYRLLGYETRALRRKDFNNDKVDAGEIGAGHTVTAIYEVTPVGSPAVLNDPLRYQQVSRDEGSEELGFLKLRYKAPGQDVSQLIQTPLVDGEALDSEARFAAAIAGFAQLLRDEDAYLGDWGYDQAIELALGARGDDPFGYRSEAIKLMRLAQSLDQ
ncbi:vWA domain-containing protein [Pseudaestuariivita rosea]|uniref:vWA domain-containing protein n=1 Tax=Pseudaestuariivita rosea TaxID=2763263 RepID=UPI001F29A992|nr:VWA domain-containing protein [Pseudaestuariivita rosea]